MSSRPLHLSLPQSTAGRVKVVAPREGGLAEVQPYRRGPASELGLVHPVADVEDAKDA